MTVAQVLKEKGNEIIDVDEGATVMDALAVLKDRRIGAVLVRREDGTIAGVLSERDVVRALPDQGGALLEQPVTVLMTRDLITCTSDDSMDRVMELMTEHRIRHVPVVDGDDMTGMISIGDVVKHRIAESEHEAAALKSYIALG